ncbi:SDR family oxidoreductase [Rhizobium helianthi]|uniref:SDR family oxidoreductase n=1 Tax=Rhizobium helianthi TaxID=1132695 RepID=A0ABW4LZX4_9HYPH
MAKILVTGASGQLGRKIIEHLIADGKIARSDIVAASRNPVKLSALSQAGIEVRKTDFDDAAGMEAAFHGIERLLLISTDELAVPGRRLAQHKAAVEAAVKAGVKHIFYTSMPNPDKSLVSFAPDHLGTEEAIKASGLTYTIIRNSWYLDNYFMSMPHNLVVGTWYTATGDGKVANISRDDCAAAAAAALASPPAGNVILTLTGETALSADEIGKIVSDTAGKPLNVVKVTDEQLANGLRGAGLPDFVVAMLVSADANTRAGNFNVVTHDFEDLTGRRPQGAAEFFKAHKDLLG